MARAKYVILLPIRLNDGADVPARQLESYLDELYVLADGYTVAGVVEGAYRMQAGAKQVDPALEVWVVLDQARERTLRAWLRRVGRELGQEAMYLERTGGVVAFVPGVRRKRRRS